MKNSNKTPRRNPSDCHWKQFFFSDFYDSDGYLEIIWCDICKKWEEYYFEEIIINDWGRNAEGLKVNCKGCGKDLLNTFLKLGDPTLERIEREGIVRWITLEEKFSYEVEWDLWATKIM